MNLAFVAFEEIKDDLLEWKLKTYPMKNDIQYQIHYSKDIPNNGIILHGALFIKDKFNIHW